MKKINVLIIDDQALMIDGLKTILELEEDITVLATGQNGNEAIALAKIYNPDVILMDIRMPVLNGVEATKTIKKLQPEIKIIILTTFDDDQLIIDALSYDADGYLLKDIDGDQLVRAIRDAINGTLLIPGNIASKIAKQLTQVSSKIEQTKSHEFLVNEILSQREVEVARLIRDGFNNKEIASILFLTEGTVKNYICKIYSKINVTNRSHAISLLKKCGL